MAKKNQPAYAKKKPGKVKKLAKLVLLAGAAYGAKKLWDQRKRGSTTKT